MTDRIYKRYFQSREIIMRAQMLDAELYKRPLHFVISPSYDHVPVSGLLEFFHRWKKVLGPQYTVYMDGDDFHLVYKTNGS